MKFITYDLGTGGIKASLYDEHLNALAKSFFEYPTYYSHPNLHEQRPDDWWKGVIDSTRHLLIETGTSAYEICCIALSGHSCVAVPLSRDLYPLTEKVPIWSDTRAVEQATEFFNEIDEKTWYMLTGNGFPAACYYLFKLMWLKKNCTDIYNRTYKVVGSKDYVNLKMTGNVYTDYSYASSSGAYDLNKRIMHPDFIRAAGLREDIFPDIIPSHQTVGHLTSEAAESLGLAKGIAVTCGGVDNACMALGAVGTQEGAVYTSLGSSSWIPVNSRQPVLDYQTKPYVFAHIEENIFTSAYSIFAGGSSFQWARDVFCNDLKGEDIYRKMDELAQKVPVGSNGIIFNPSLAGGTSQDKSPNIRGAFIGLHLGTTREEMIRSTLEGIALNLRTSLELLSNHVTLSNSLLFCGGGSKSRFWMQMFADIFNKEIIKSNIDQDAASFGAAAICAKNMGLFRDYSHIPDLHQIEHRYLPNTENHLQYNKVYNVFQHISNVVSDLGDFMANV